MAATIELYLVRHAIAAERGPKYPDDRERPLTVAGSKKFSESVPGLIEMGVVIDFVLTSPLVRARETATLLASGLKPKPALAEIEALAPGGRSQAVIEAIKTHSKRHRRLALVGHEVTRRVADFPVGTLVPAADLRPVRLGRFRLDLHDRRPLLLLLLLGLLRRRLLLLLCMGKTRQKASRSGCDDRNHRERRALRRVVRHEAH